MSMSVSDTITSIQSFTISELSPLAVDGSSLWPSMYKNKLGVSLSAFSLVCYLRAGVAETSVKFHLSVPFLFIFLLSFFFLSKIHCLLQARHSAVTSFTSISKMSLVFCGHKEDMQVNKNPKMC